MYSRGEQFQVLLLVRLCSESVETLVIFILPQLARFNSCIWVVVEVELILENEAFSLESGVCVTK